MKFSDFSNEKYRLNSFSVRIKYQPTVPNFLDSSLESMSNLMLNYDITLTSDAEIAITLEKSIVDYNYLEFVFSLLDRNAVSSKVLIDMEKTSYFNWTDQITYSTSVGFCKFESGSQIKISIRIPVAEYQFEHKLIKIIASK